MNAFIVFGVLSHDAKQIVVLAANQIALKHLRYLPKSLFKVLERFLALRCQGKLDKELGAKSKLLG